MSNRMVASGVGRQGMNLESYFCLRAPLALALKTPSGAEFGPFGDKWGGGFNAELEIGWSGSLCEEDCRRAFQDLVKRLDHRHLGFDAAELKVTTPDSLLEFATDVLSERGFRPAFVRMGRGTDVVYEQLNSDLPSC